MASSEREAERVAQEKKRASLGMGDPPAKAEKYAQGVRDYAAQERAKEQKKGRG